MVISTMLTNLRNASKWRHLITLNSSFFVIVLPDFGLDTAAMVIELDSKLRAKWIKLTCYRMQANKWTKWQGELEALATAIKDVYFQDYKTAYEEVGFDHMQAIDRGNHTLWYEIES